MIYLHTVYILVARISQFVDLQEAGRHSHASGAGNASLKGGLCAFLGLPKPQARPGR